MNAHPECLAEILIEYPYLQSRYEEYRMLLDDPNTIDRPRVQLDVMRHAEQTYKINTGEDLQHWQRLQLAKFTRNLAMIEGRPYRRRVRHVGGRTRRSSTTTTDGKSGNRRIAIRRSARTQRSRNLNLSAEEVWRDAKNPAAPPPAALQAKAPSQRLKQAQEGEVAGRVGQPVRTATASARIRRKIW